MNIPVLTRCPFAIYILASFAAQLCAVEVGFGVFYRPTPCDCGRTVEPATLDLELHNEGVELVRPQQELDFEIEVENGDEYEDGHLPHRPRFA